MELSVSDKVTCISRVVPALKDKTGWNSYKGILKKV